MKEIKKLLSSQLIAEQHLQDLYTQLQRSEMASEVTLPIEHFRDILYMAIEGVKSVMEKQNGEALAEQPAQQQEFECPRCGHCCPAQQENGCA